MSQANNQCSITDVHVEGGHNYVDYLLAITGQLIVGDMPGDSDQ